MIWIFPLSKISSVIGGKYKKMYYLNKGLLHYYPEANNISSEEIFNYNKEDFLNWNVISFVHLLSILN